MSPLKNSSLARRRVTALAAVVTASTLALTACSGSANGDSSGAGNGLTKVDLVLDWTPNTNHTGIYVALENGYFEDQGLDVNVIQPPEDGADALVGAGRAQFGVSYQENVTQARQAGVPIVSIAAIIAHNTSGFASPADRGINSPKDYEGHAYGGWGSPIETAILEAVVEADNGDPSKVKNVSIGSTDPLTAFKKDIDIVWLFEAWDIQQAKLQGQDLHLDLLRDYNEALDWYTPVFASNESTIEDSPEIVQSFVSAVTDGYEYAIENPEESADILLKSVPDLDEELVRASQNFLAGQYQADSAQWGYQRPEVWEKFSGWLTENQIIEPGFDYASAYTNQFVDTVQAEDAQDTQAEDTNE